MTMSGGTAGAAGGGRSAGPGAGGCAAFAPSAAAPAQAPPPATTCTRGPGERSPATTQPACAPGHSAAAAPLDEGAGCCMAGLGASAGGPRVMAMGAAALRLRGTRGSLAGSAAGRP